MPLHLLRLIAALSPPIHLLGGFAEDVLLRGTISPGRRDLDLLVPADQLVTAAGQLTGIGLSWQPDDDQPGLPWLFSAPNQLPVEVWPCGAVTDGFQILVPGLQERLYRLTLPSTTFLTPPTPFSGFTIHTVSPLALYLLRAASAATRHMAERRENDLMVMQQLRERFLTHVAEADLVPVLEQI